VAELRERPRALVLNDLDNVAVAVVALKSGERVAVGRASVELAQDIPSGHKFALASLAPGSDVVKYGEVIGKTTAAVRPGEHVHVHNVVSARLPGPGVSR
jgi:altronate dehydratase small subunit